ncbi:MAG: RdgB/HAM1 family non-canonical purine NTP pyrophosphatase [Tepidisphaerales bacterium]
MSRPSPRPGAPPATPGPIDRLVIATGNRGKLREFAELLSPLGLVCLDLAAAAEALHRPQPAEPAETGSSFLENACLKAVHYATSLGLWTLADDSGLVVDALGGEPGVDSAYFAAKYGHGSPTDDRASRDAANNRLLLERLRDVPPERRAARFVCAIALATPEGQVVATTTGEVAGRILDAPRGGGGFGYDPLFEVEGLGRTSAELLPAEKHRISHRGMASRRMVALLAELKALPPSKHPPVDTSGDRS